MRGRVLEARGSKHVTSVTVLTAEGRRAYACDALVLSLGWAPRDTLLRMSPDPEVSAAGDVALPGCTLAEAEASGRAAASGEPVEPRIAEPWPILEEAGYVCVCEDVGVDELEAAWDEGWTGSEILKRYTTATMGPCQGALCSRHLAAFTEAKGAVPKALGRTTARPPARAPRLEDLIGGVHEAIERRTALHERHVAARRAHRPLGRRGCARPTTAMCPRRSARSASASRSWTSRRSGSSSSPGATRGRCSTGRSRSTSARWRRGRARYLLALDEAGYVMDDGLLAALADGAYYLTSTSGGADRMEAALRELGRPARPARAPREPDGAARRDQRRRAARARPARGAVRRRPVAGGDPVPGSRGDQRWRASRAVRSPSASSGELSYELHHPRGSSVALWDALLEAGRAWDIRPHGLDALDVLRLEKGHIFLAQDTMPDDHPTKLGLDWAVALDKPSFVGKQALDRMASLPLDRKLVGLRFDGTPQRGAPLAVEGTIVGRVTSCAVSEAVGAPIGLGWIRTVDDVFPQTLAASDITATVVPTPFYDPEGVRLRG